MTQANDESKSNDHLARRIWLAGIGAYGQSVDSLQDGVDKVSSETKKLFDDLVERGESLEETTATKLKQSTDIDQRIKSLRDKIGLGTSDTDEKLDLLVEKVDDLTKMVAEILGKKT